MSLPTTVSIQRVRGDTYPLVFVVKDGSGNAIDITGYSFTLTVDPEESPVHDVNNLLQITGVITDASNGKVSFTPTAQDADQEPGEYFFDVEMTDDSSAIRTIAKGGWEVVQDITK